ncbi:tetraacyldisaccharide 4'-kinase [Ovoidimarina sediminis]|uniref:tetraacyldisaccharide 4'-kinase n=1 Tax=Ovoidimarina sediminis TaxID=3079856 RepID=UPI00290AE5ED|nr:tetraacyldisaccharide 4'-kinase [Rhodophyticola sp. MJ-SS7]MDU8942442.1 tetraacyldisaccharide 4'-kinase [Rhodophyticola sp. MJ-SS7]
MRAPRFWNRPTPGWQAHLLAPLAALYARATAARVARAPDLVPDRPVICLGNLNAGGTGKTPSVIALAEMLKASGTEPAIVSRGYGGTLEGPARVDPTRHSAAEVGDEPLLIAAFAPVWVARNRAEGVRAALAEGAPLVILDDGHQNPAVAKALSVVVVDAAVGFGNGCVIPAGPLREPVSAGLNRADAVLSIGPPEAQAAFRQRWGAEIPGPLLTASLQPLQTGLPLAGLRVLAFAGIGRPEKFFDTLRRERAEILRAVPLGDHQPLTEGLMRRLEHDASSTGAQLVTTEKDAVRLPKSFRQKVMTVPVRLVFDDPAAVRALLEATLSG